MGVRQSVRGTRTAAVRAAKPCLPLTDSWRGKQKTKPHWLLWSLPCGLRPARGLYPSCFSTAPLQNTPRCGGFSEQPCCLLTTPWTGQVALGTCCRLSTPFLLGGGFPCCILVSGPQGSSVSRPRRRIRAQERDVSLGGRRGRATSATQQRWGSGCRKKLQQPPSGTGREPELRVPGTPRKR